VTTSPLRHLRAVEPSAHAPNAALLIDFDNVTLGIRSDLAKELKSLLNSAIIKGKVAVSRAYADWRRYPQYIVPLSESSIDLIFAPAFGTNKKNATDIRLAIDAMELVFTRPEIGTFILLSGDSDFSMLVIKLKEYGKYVIGVGMRESASDLLIQNCDEYYSYSDLAGLTRETDMPSVQRDPWELVREAVATMARSGDVMRSDRLKQVMQQLDSTFDERNAGFSRFSKFVLEANKRGLLKSSKLENGQYEIAPAEAEPPKTPATAAAPASAEPMDDRRRRGRGRGRGRGGRAAPTEPWRPRPLARGVALARAFDLMRLALSELPGPTGHEALRLRMAALHGREDPVLSPEQFARFLRQAHDAEVADVRKLGEDEFESSSRTESARATGSRPRPRSPEPSAAGAAEAAAESSTVATAEAPTVRGGIRFRRGSRAGGALPAIPMVGVVTLHDEAPAEPAVEGSRDESPRSTGCGVAGQEGRGQRPQEGRGMRDWKRAATLPVAFFCQDVIEVGRALLGAVLVTSFEGHTAAGRIVEVEAYLGAADPASHAYEFRRNRQNESIYASPGDWYVYRSTGVTGAPIWCAVRRAGRSDQGSGAARGARCDVVVAGPGCQTGCCAGPGRLCRAIESRGELDGADGGDRRRW
jgi:uncharacterized protein (TIGR00288 family)